MAKESTALAPLAIDPQPFIWNQICEDDEYAIGDGRFPIINGQPLTDEILSTKFQEYLDFCQKQDEQPVIGGLTSRLGIYREMLWEWESRYPSLTRTIKIIRERMLAEAERRLTTRRGLTNHVGLIFWLKNTFGWCDKQETLSQTVSVNVTIDGGENPELVRSLAAEYRARRLTGGNQGQLPAPVESKKE